MAPHHPRRRGAAGLPFGPLSSLPLGLVVSLLALAACSTVGILAPTVPGQTYAPAPPSTVQPTSTRPASPSAPPTKRPAVKSATVSPTPTPALTLADYLTRLPRFGPAPAPVPVDLPHAADRSAWAGQIPTSQPVAFLTIDDGVVKAPDALALLRAAHVRVTLFLTINDIRDNVGYFAHLQAAGAVIESHTVSHPHLPTLSYDRQRDEICRATDQLGEWYGRRPVLFRPPYGEKNDDTLRAAASCGLAASFSWKETVNAGVVRYQTSVHRIQPGDIILMHFRSTFDADFVAALQAIHAAGLTPGLLEDYLSTA